MPFVFSKYQKMAAFFIIFGLILLIAVMFFIAKGNRTFEKKGHFYTFFEDSKGIYVGSQIKFKGFVVGKVTKVTLLKDYRTRVDFVIYKEYLNLIRYDTVIKMSASLLGSSGLTISFIQSQNSLLLPNNSEVLSSDMKEGQDILIKISENLPKQDDLTAKATQVLDMIIDLKPLIYTILLNLRDTTIELKVLATSLNGKGDSETAKQLFVILNKVNSTIDLLYPTLENFKEVSVDAKELTTKLKNDLPKITSDINNLTLKLDKLLVDIKYLPDDLKEILELAKKNLIQLKYVLENLPLIPKNSSTTSTTVIQGR